MIQANTKLQMNSLRADVMKAPAFRAKRGGSSLDWPNVLESVWFLSPVPLTKGRASACESVSPQAVNVEAQICLGTI